MYNSPIEMLITDIQNQIVKQQDQEIYQAVLHYVPNVDKEELIRALKYDRNQYNKGYADGIRDAREELVRCKECKYCVETTASYTGIACSNGVNWRTVEPNHFCSYGERKKDHE